VVEHAAGDGLCLQPQPVTRGQGAFDALTPSARRPLGAA
jgi:hypothetical protein